MKQKLRKHPYIILAVVMIAALLRALAVQPIEQILSSEKEIVPNEQWQETRSEAEGIEYSEYRCLVPEEMGRELVLSIRTYKSAISVWLDDEEIYAYSSSNGEQGVCWKWIDLPEDAQGKVLTLQVSYAYEKSREAFGKSIYLGDKNTVFLKILKENILVVLGGSLAVMTGLAIWLGGAFLRKSLLEDVRREINYLGAFIFVAGVWSITDSSVLQFVTGRNSVVMVVSFTSFMLMPFFILKYIEKIMFGKNKAVKILCTIHLANMMVTLLLYILRVFRLQQMLWVTHALLVISIGVVVKSALEEVKKYQNSEMKKIVIGIGALIVFGGIALLSFYTNFTFPYSVLYGIGIFAFELCLIASGFDRLSYYLNTSANAEQYWWIAHVDIMTQMGNRMSFKKQQEENSGQKCKGYVVLDINNLKKANDTYGHQEGDRLIADSARCIKEAFGELGDCYRIGGDEFAVILDTVAEDRILAAVEDLEQKTRQESEGRIVPIEIACGYAVRHEETADHADLFHEADANMYVRKQEMKNKKPDLSF